MSLSGVDLNLLVALDALLAERSVTRAASRLGLSQPGMSNTLARLRKLFGDPLLVREGLTLVPTPRAESLRQPVADALSLIQQALDNRPGFDPGTDHATFTVSCSDYSLLMLIGPLVRRLAATRSRPDHPGPAPRLRRGPPAPRRRGRPGHRADRDHAGGHAAQPAAVRRPLALLRMGGDHRGRRW